MKKGTNWLSQAMGRSILALLFVAGFTTAALAAYTATVTSTSTYIAGQSNTINFVATHTSPNAEYIDNFIFTFPAGVTVTGTAGSQPYAFCGGDAGNASFAGTVAQWLTPFHPSGCGAFNGGPFNFSVTVNVPAGFTGPLNVAVQTQGDGWPGQPQISDFTVPIAADVPPAPPEPCVLNCPAD
ncbi:MAG: hypothetical protein IT270_16145, partial [Saprospiraceae bacterium]|nr:hypothetical protein [Saprospiraceae bacterium]MCC6413195.1 hypothetical protein [Saprospiraceae bacterium]